MLGDGTTTLDVESLEIDGQPYVPPAPAPKPRQRWEILVELGDSDAGPVAGGNTPICMKLGGDTMYAKVRLGFDSDGNVWMADGEARKLADFLHEMIVCDSHINQYTRDKLRRAAERLAGPEE